MGYNRKKGDRERKVKRTKHTSKHNRRDFNDDDNYEEVRRSIGKNRRF